MPLAPFHTSFVASKRPKACGFESPDSDFDVRLVYVRPIEYYLRLQSTRDVLEWRLDEVLDVSGWDLDKALRLMRGANPSLFEWLASPIVYAEDSAFAAVRDLAADCFSPVSSAHHYLSMARTGMSGLTGTTRMADKADKAAVAGGDDPPQEMPVRHAGDPRLPLGGG